MFDFTFSKNRLKSVYSVIGRLRHCSNGLFPLFWTEHCVECSAPACYTTCPRFRRRADGDCIRIVNGITPIADDRGVGAKIEFRTWAKIESQLKTRMIPSGRYTRLYQLLTFFGYLFRRMAALSPSRTLQKFIDDGWFSYRQKIINLLIKKTQPSYALTLHGEVSNNDKPITLLVDVKNMSQHLFREAVDIPLGDSKFKVNIPPYESAGELYFINIHPANAEEHVSLTFKYLELEPTEITNGKKIKCVIWDLDNTLWDGVLIESKNVKAKNDLIELIKHLDECGIVNSIASKNDETEAKAKLRELGIDEYFVFKKINWDPKSVNISKTIKQMNINPDTVVFVDDNPFERNEVKLSQPGVTCMDPSEMLEFSRCNRFNAIVTEDSQKRRGTYQMLESMVKEEEEWTGNIDDFLRSCHIQLRLSSSTEATIPRCYELLQRTNQLNSSGRRLTMDEVRQIVNSNDYDTYVLNSSDKFGDYGIVGFLIVQKAEKKAMVTDFVISCRVANKKIEPTLINYLAGKYNGILFNYKKTNRNGPMFRIIKELGMKKISEQDGYETYECNYQTDYSDIVAIN